MSTGASSHSTRVLILEDQDVVRRLLQDIVRDVYPRAETVEAALCADAMAAIASHDFDLAIIDLSLPDGNGTEVIRKLKREQPTAEVVVTTIFQDDAHLFDAMEAGATGYLLKEGSRAELVASLRGLKRGVPALSPAVSRRLIASFHSKEPFHTPQLTPREREVLKLIAKGLNRADIAELLGLSKNTVSEYIKAVYRKLEVSSRAEAALEAERMGLVRQSR